MASLNDEIVRATGLPYNEGLSSWFSRTARESLADAENRWLLTQTGVTDPTSTNDLWRIFLEGVPNNYTGSLNDMKLLYWKAQP